MLHLHLLDLHAVPVVEVGVDEGLRAAMRVGLRGLAVEYLSMRHVVVLGGDFGDGGRFAEVEEVGAVGGRELSGGGAHVATTTGSASTATTAAKQQSPTRFQLPKRIISGGSAETYSRAHDTSIHMRGNSHFPTWLIEKGAVATRDSEEGVP